MILTDASGTALPSSTTPRRSNDWSQRGGPEGTRRTYSHLGGGAGLQPQWQEGDLPYGHNRRARLQREEGGLQSAVRAQNHHATTQRQQGELGDRGTLPGKELTRFQTKTGLRFPTKSDH